MALNQKAIKTRITSVKNTKKITKAMEMVSAAKMRRAIEAALGTRTYATLARELMERLSHVNEPDAPLLATRSTQNVLVVLISSNRGLCGSFNSNVAKAARSVLADITTLATHTSREGETIAPQDNVHVKVMGIGKRSASFAKREGHELIAVYDDIGEKPQIEQTVVVAQQIIQGFVNGDYDKVVVAYTDFKSAIAQIPRVSQILPVTADSLAVMAEQLGDDKSAEVATSIVDPEIETYLFEPDAETILNQILPRLVEVQLFQAILESSASEHSSRMVAMKNASEAAGDMIDQLTLESNKARQAAITQEIAEIAGGAAALA